jgi:ATP-dependent Clp protease adaptor protein ClpS
MSESDTKINSDVADIVKVDNRQRVRKPSKVRVVLLNDDYSTMEFVVYILETIFLKPPAEAVQIMLKVHNEGRAVCGTYTYQVAEAKVAAVHSEARANGYPLKCIIE